MKKEGEVITEHNYPDIYKWLSENVSYYKEDQKYYTLTSEGKINAYCYVSIDVYAKQIKYPFGCVNGFFSCNGCKNLTSLIGAPEKVGEYFSCDGCSNLTSLIGFPKHVKSVYFNSNRFSNNPSKKEKYKLYLAMWLELLESISNKEREEYITNYKDKKSRDESIIPIEILKEYGF